MNKIIKNTLILTAITLISGLLLGMVYEITKDPIAASQEKARQEAYKAVLKEADSFADYADFDEKEAAKAVKDISGCTVNGVAEAKDKSGETIGYVVTTTSSEGYGGDDILNCSLTLVHLFLYFSYFFLLFASAIFLMEPIACFN